MQNLLFHLCPVSEHPQNFENPTLALFMIGPIVMLIVALCDVTKSSSTPCSVMTPLVGCLTPKGLLWTLFTHTESPTKHHCSRKINHSFLQEAANRGLSMLLVGDNYPRVAAPLESGMLNKELNMGKLQTFVLPGGKRNLKKTFFLVLQKMTPSTGWTWA